MSGVRVLVGTRKGAFNHPCCARRASEIAVSSRKIWLDVLAVCLAADVIIQLEKWLRRELGR